MQRHLRSVFVAATAVLALAGCGSDGGSSASGADFNDADVRFAQSMIPHHEQAVEMAELARTRAGAPEVRDLAREIESAQGPEIATMEDWLEDWDQEAPAEGGHGSHGSGDAQMPGMMGEDDLTALQDTTGAAFDRRFLDLMIEHHTGAIEMAKAERAQGENDEAKALAKRVQADQTAEIATMKALLAS